jgi:hypothetical protein
MVQTIVWSHIMSRVALSVSRLLMAIVKFCLVCFLKVSTITDAATRYHPNLQVFPSCQCCKKLLPTDLACLNTKHISRVGFGSTVHYLKSNDHLNLLYVSQLIGRHTQKWVRAARSGVLRSTSVKLQFISRFFTRARLYRCDLGIHAHSNGTKDY